MNQDKDDPAHSPPSGPLIGEFNALDDMSPAEQKESEARLAEANAKLIQYGGSLGPAVGKSYNLKGSNLETAYFDTPGDAEPLLLAA